MARNFRKPKSAVEEHLWLKETTPRNTRNSTKWSVKIFEDWQLARSNKVARSESFGFQCKNIEEIQNLTVRITEMHPASLNFWMTKFVSLLYRRFFSLSQIRRKNNVCLPERLISFQYASPIV